MSNEAWKDTGDCAECRRKAYCNKTCTANKKRLKQIIATSFIRSAVTGKIYPKLAHLMEETNNG